ncbi:MAG: hypothetical protein V4568_02405 [Pseudomonadota bacterium]
MCPIQANKFLATYDIVSSGKCRKKSDDVLVISLDRSFQVSVSWQDNPLAGEPGDWLVQDGEDSYEVVDGNAFDKSYDIVGSSYKHINIDSPKIRISGQLNPLLAMSDDVQNCLLGKDVAILKFYPRAVYTAGEIVLYQPLDDGHPSEVWYQARVTQIRENGY